MRDETRATHGESLAVPIELREADAGPQIVGCLIQEGRAASVRPEVFAPLSSMGRRRDWPSVPHI